MRAHFAAALLLALAGTAAKADDTPAGAALVSTVAPRQGSLPEILTAYGAAGPAQNGGLAISLQQDGRIAAIAVTQGELVAAGTRLMVFDVSPSGVSTYSQAVSGLALAQSQRAHAAQMLAQHLVTRDQLAQADKALSDARATLDALVRQGAGRPRIDVAAPFAGIVESLLVAQGDRVAAGAPLLRLTRLDGLVVTVGVDPALHGRVHPGQPVRLRSLDGAAEFAASVLRVDGVVNPKTRLIDVDVDIAKANPQSGQVISGQLFRAEITLGDLPGWIVPHDAVLDDDHGFYLFQLAGDKAARVGVRVLATQGNDDAVAGSLDAGRKVIVDGATQLSDGDAVRIAP